MIIKVPENIHEKKNKLAKMLVRIFEGKCMNFIIEKSCLKCHQHAGKGNSSKHGVLDSSSKTSNETEWA
jgi:hypothetical protein